MVTVPENLINGVWNPEQETKKIPNDEVLALFKLVALQMYGSLENSKGRCLIPNGEFEPYGFNGAVYDGVLPEWYLEFQETYSWVKRDRVKRALQRIVRGNDPSYVDHPVGFVPYQWSYDTRLREACLHFLIFEKDIWGGELPDIPEVHEQFSFVRKSLNIPLEDDLNKKYMEFFESAAD